MMVVQAATVNAPTISAELLGKITAAVRSFDDDDGYAPQLAGAVARGIEVHTDRLVWPSARTSTAVVHQRAGGEIDHFPSRPRTTGGVVSSVKLWRDGAYVDAGHTVAAPTTVRVPETGIYQIVSTVTIADAAVEPHIIEGAARLFAFLWQLRPGDVQSSGMQQSIAGALIKSGAAEVLGSDEVFTM